LKEWVIVRKRSISAYIYAYFSWFCLSIILCAVPILFSPFFAELTVSYSSLLAYCFTLLASSVYLFDHHVEATEKRSDLAKAARDIAVLLMVIAVVVFVVYNLHNDINKFLNGVIEATIPLTAVLAFIPTFIITMPLINREARTKVREREVDNTMAVAEETKSKMRDMEKDLKESIKNDDKDVDASPLSGE